MRSGDLRGHSMEPRRPIRWPVNYWSKQRRAQIQYRMSGDLWITPYVMYCTYIYIYIYIYIHTHNTYIHYIYIFTLFCDMCYFKYDASWSWLKKLKTDVTTLSPANGPGSTPTVKMAIQTGETLWRKFVAYARARAHTHTHTHTHTHIHTKKFCSICIPLYTTSLKWLCRGLSV